MGVPEDITKRQGNGVAKVFRFDQFVVDMNSFELRCASAIVPVEPLVLDLIAFLVKQPGVVLDYTSLIATVWQGRIVSDNTISTAIKSARKALGDSGKSQKYIRTIRGRGIQFSAEVKPQTVSAAAAPVQVEIGMQPALYVRPFVALGAVDLSGLSRIFWVRLRSALTRIPLLRVASPFEQADAWTDSREFRSRLGMTLVLDCSLQQSGDALLADVTLIETRQGIEIWARQFQVAAGDQAIESLLHDVMGRLEPRVMQFMLKELKSVQGEPGPRQNLLRAIGLLALKGWHRQTFLEATSLLETAIRQEPHAALAHAYLAMLKGLGHRVGILRDRDTVVPEAIAAAERALELESQDSTILGLVGCSLVDVGQVERAMLILKKAIEVDPQNGQAKTALGTALMMKKDYAGAVALLAEGIAGSPADSRRSVWGTALALGLLAQGKPAAAQAAAAAACMEDDRNYLPRLALAAVYLAQGNAAATSDALRECLRTKPDLSQQEVACIVGSRMAAAIWDMLLTLRR